jgi:hypothetical protein
MSQSPSGASSCQIAGGGPERSVKAGRLIVSFGELTLMQMM